MRYQLAFTAAMAAVLMTLCSVPAIAAMEDFPIVRLQSLDKTTARTMTFEARVGSTIKFGPLYIRTQACRKAPPMEQPESAAFLQVWEVDLKTEEPQWVFSGWMFASSPALSPMDHPVYDVWVIDCIAEDPPVPPSEIAPEPEADQDEPEVVEDVVDSEAEALPEPE